MLLVHMCGMILFMLGKTASDECQNEALPFLCLRDYPIFSCAEKKVILPTKEGCEWIISTTCQVEVNLAYTIELGNLFPDCNELPSGISGSGKFTTVDKVMLIKHFKLLKLLCFDVYTI